MQNQRLDLLTLQEAMDMLGVSRATIDRWRKDKQLPFIKIGKEILLEKQKLNAWIQLHSHAGPHPKQPKEMSDSDRIVSVGYQSGAALLWSPLIIKKLGLFEEELQRMCPSAQYQVRWVNSPNGIELVEGLIAGRVHIASLGDYPMIACQTLSQILPNFKPTFLAFDGKTSHGGGISLVVPSSSPFQRIEDLAESTISIVANSSASCRLGEMMSSFGLDQEPVIHRRMGECLNGIVEGSIGASVLWEPYLSWVQWLGKGIPIGSEAAGGDYLTGLMADEQWLLRNEVVMIAYMKAHLRAHDLIRRAPLRAAEMIHEASGFPMQVVTSVLSQIRWDASLYSRDLQTLANMKFQGAERLPGHQRKYDGFAVQEQYLLHAVEALKLPVLPDSPLPGEWSPEMIY
ncbi:helix-turn-helix domain-containing protein [Paenibacillus eucommiae]|uniref:NitT/TauT family transport system substrate-binding protein n=1 Tax=Paenibacillus eucommiae TaxID=1355755 RepID=A0ABS4IZ91_9BACL|nr:helix-turn-helix domain-containing protein [Paenibacillus eucommiae]MBP1992171.1 NitT/TauT family transport system substrate-binding protein [Paenibacillus eucommiae]